MDVLNSTTAAFKRPHRAAIKVQVLCESLGLIHVRCRKAIRDSWRLCMEYMYITGILPLVL